MAHSTLLRAAAALLLVCLAAAGSDHGWCAKPWSRASYSGPGCRCGPLQSACESARVYKPQQSIRLPAARGLQTLIAACLPGS